MNYAGSFHATQFVEGPDGHSAWGHVDSFSVQGRGSVPRGAFVVPDPDLLFNGEFKRSGVDLILSKEDREFVLHDYFKGEKRAAIASPDGAHLTGDIVKALTGYVQYSQAAPGAAAGKVIGHVTKLIGNATAIRNGVSIVLNQGDNVEKGDVVQSGSNSTLGITFVDGTVFGLSANARMVLNEMVYDPNGSNNSSLLSLVVGTITFVAGETAKRGDMKIDTPVATMGIRGTAVLSELRFIIPPGGGDAQPEADFQVLVEPDGTTGSYILYDKTTLLPIATVNQAGQQIHISGGNVTISDALLSPEVQKLISDVFSLKFTDNTNNNTKLTTNFTNTIVPDSGFSIKSASGAIVIPTFVNLANNANSQGPGQDTAPFYILRIPGPPQAVVVNGHGQPATAFSTSELADRTGDSADFNTIEGAVNFVDLNLGDRPTVTVDFTSFTYQSASHDDVTATLSALQLADIKATEITIKVVPDPGNTNHGSAKWTYSVPDNAFDFLAAGEVLTLTYTVRVDNNFAANNETAFIPITITVTGTNDAPSIATSVQKIQFSGGTSVPGGPLSTNGATSGTLTFTDADLTDSHSVSVALTSADLPGGTVPPGPLAIFEQALSVSLATDSIGAGAGKVNWKLADLPVYLADFIPEDEVLTLTYTVTVTDPQHAASTQTITVTIKGTDSPAQVWIATTRPGSPPGGLWKDGANWETGLAPTINDDVIIITDQLHGLTPSFPVKIDAPAFAKSVAMNDFGSTPPVLVNLNSLTIAADLSLSEDAILDNSGTISVGGKAEILNQSVLQNCGTITLAAGGDFKDQSSITNKAAGKIEVLGGTLNVLVDVDNAGLIRINSTAKLVLGSAAIDGGTVTIFGTLDLDGTSFLDDGTLNNSGAVHVNGNVAFRYETVNNTGMIQVLAGGSLAVVQGSTVDNTGGQIKIDGLATLTLNDSASISGGKLTNSGDLYVEASSGARLDGVNVDNSGGTIHVNQASDSAVLILESGTFISSGTLAIGELGTVDVSSAAGATLSGVIVNVACHGEVQVESGSELLLNDATINGGTLTIDGTLDSTGTSFITGATINNSGNIEVAGGTLTIDPTPIINTGTILVTNDSTLVLSDEILTNSVGDPLTEAVASGTIQVDGTDSTHFSTLKLANSTIDGGVIEISGLLTSCGDSFITGAALANSGTIDVTGGTLTIDASSIVTNSSVIAVDDGKLIIDTAISGSLEIKGASILELGANEGFYSQTTVTFETGSTGALVLDQAAPITGGSGLTVVGLDDNWLDFHNIVYSSTLTVSYAGDATGGVLSIYDNGTDVADIKLSGNYLGVRWALADDGSSQHGTTIKEVPGTISGLDANGNAVENVTLTASVTDGGQTVTAAVYNWLVSTDGTHWSEAAGVNGAASYTPVEADEGKLLKVDISFTDFADDTETTTVFAGTVQESLADDLVATLDADTAQQGQTIHVTSVTDGGIAVTDGLTYAWQVSSDGGQHWTTVGTNSSYTPSAADAGDLLQVVVTYTEPGDIESVVDSLGIVAVAPAKEWKGGTHSWNVPGQWSPSGVPTSGDDVIIDAGGIYKLTIDQASAAHSLSMDALAKVEIVGGATLTLSGDLKIDAGVFQINSGGTLKVTAGSAEIDGSFIANGAVEAAGGTLEIASAFVFGTGTFKIDWGATLQLDHVNTHDVVFDGSGTLILKDPSHFYGTISDSAGSMSGDDVLDLAGFDTSARVSYIGTAAGGIVKVTQAHHATALIHVGPNSTHWSAPVSDGHGGILIHDPPDDVSTPAPCPELLSAMGLTGNNSFVFNSAADTFIDHVPDADPIHIGSSNFAGLVLPEPIISDHDTPGVTADADTANLHNVLKMPFLPHQGDFHFV